MVSKGTQKAKRLVGGADMRFFKKKRSRAGRRAGKDMIRQIRDGKDDAVFAPKGARIAAWEIC